MEKVSIAKIKEQIALGMLSDSEIGALQDDSRSGVRALVKRELNARQAMQRELDRVEEMLEFERGLWSRGIEFVAGVDEVGVGPLAGPVIAAAVVLPQNSRILGVDDSKKLTHKKRQHLAAQIKTEARSFAFGMCSPREIDHHNIYQASRLAMSRAVKNLPKEPGHLLVDARTVPQTTIAQTNMIHGDARSYSIAAASILAKVERDILMERYALDFPGYGFENHRGYGTAMHLKALRDMGPTPIHRSSFAPVAHAAALHSS
tara:strand:- start:700 stop:1482 length:783 start_codon:yes stop_codon:yes gene_type:complete